MRVPEREAARRASRTRFGNRASGSLVWRSIVGVTSERCGDCGGALGPGADFPPCLCDLSPLVEEPRPPAEAGGGTHARALKCPSCGGWLETGARRCTYCRVELASVRCWRCFDLSFAGTAICARCGASLGLEGDLGPTSSRCPDCTEALHLVDVGDHRVQECPTCAGLLVDHATLRHLTEMREADGGEAMPGQVARRPLLEEVKYRKCPSCEHVMTRRNFGRTSGVIVDHCKDHGVWFDTDELTHVLEFVASGGLRLTRATELTEAKEELSRRRLAALGEQLKTTRAYESTSGYHSAGALLSVLADFLGR